MPANVEAAPPRPDFVGVVTSKNSQIIPTSFTGRIDRVDVHPGQRVHKGDPIARLDSTDLKSKIEGYLAQERAAAAEAGAYGASASAAHAKYGAVQKLRKMGVAAGMEVTGAEAEWKSQGAQSGAAMARGGTAKADRAVAERQLSHAQMTSPLDGIVMMLKAKEGQVAQSGEPIARVFDPSDLLIRFSVPKDYRKDVKLGGRVELHIDGVERVVWATVDRISDEEAPINFAVVEADIDDSKLGPDEVRIASVGHVRLAENTPTKTSTNAVATGAVR